jgi:hypothetical protein
LDQKIKVFNLAVQKRLPKLAYFSSRLGFKEFQNSITAATQCLHACDSPRWTLMTLTHELLHAHVRAILASILIPSKGELPEDAAKRFAVEHASNIDERKFKNLEKFTVIGFLRHCLFEYSDYYHESNNSPFDAPQMSIAAAQVAEGQMHRLKNAFPFINEIMVHTLDLPYFYNDDLTQYLKSLWDSWSTIPGVVDRIDAYLLRSLVAAGSLKAANEKIELVTRKDELLANATFSLTQSFDSACKEVSGAIAELQAVGGKSVILNLIVEHLVDPKARKHLRKLYPANLKLAMVTREFFLSNSIKNHLSAVSDKFSDFDAEKGEIYRLEEKDLVQEGIANPLRFLQDRLRRGLGIQGLPDKQEEWKSAWVLHALASIKAPN